MHIMITQEGPPYPPAAYGPMNTPAGDNLLVQPTVFTDYWNNRVRPFYTHGLHLEAEVGLDPQLRYLLMRCMADLPGDRPTPGELQMWALRKEAEPGWNDPNDGTRAWWASVLQSAPDVSRLLTGYIFLVCCCSWSRRDADIYMLCVYSHRPQRRKHILHSPPRHRPVLLLIGLGTILI